MTDLNYTNSQYPSVDSLREKARHRIPGFAFDYLDGGCNEEVNLRKNTEEIRRIELIPRYLGRTGDTDLHTTLFGHTYDAPFGIAPIGLQGLVWPGAAEILARAAFEQNLPFILSTVSTGSIERVSELTGGKAWFQLYHPAEKKITDDLIKRVDESGYPVLVILADVPSFGYRSKEIKNGLAMPPRMTLKNVFQIMSRPNWAVSTLLHGKPEFGSLKPYMGGAMNMHHLGLFMNKTFNGKLDIDKLAYLRDKWKRKIVLKGVACEEDAEKAISLGFDGLIVSNHGGRQLDAAESAIESLKRIKSVCDGKITLMMDSGLRSGPDIARVLATGAQFTFLGRAFMYGVAALGKNGGHHTINILKKQLRQVLDQVSCAAPTDLPSRLITK
ncbi:MAG TPA: alpha-hydroxy acid oxidase [Puia sp.]|nr:alpha-hydroxy acid oxidase [Puia sp.]